MPEVKRNGRERMPERDGGGDQEVWGDKLLFLNKVLIIFIQPK